MSSISKSPMQFLRLKRGVGTLCALVVCCMLPLGLDISRAAALIGRVSRSKLLQELPPKSIDVLANAEPAAASTGVTAARRTTPPVRPHSVTAAQLTKGSTTNSAKHRAAAVYERQPSQQVHKTARRLVSQIGLPDRDSVFSRNLYRVEVGAFLNHTQADVPYYHPQDNRAERMKNVQLMKRHTKWTYVRQAGQPENVTLSTETLQGRGSKEAIVGSGSGPASFTCTRTGASYSDQFSSESCDFRNVIVNSPSAWRALCAGKLQYPICGPYDTRIARIPLIGLPGYEWPAEALHPKPAFWKDRLGMARSGFRHRWPTRTAKQDVVGARWYHHDGWTPVAMASGYRSWSQVQRLPFAQFRARAQVAMAPAPSKSRAGIRSSVERCSAWVTRPVMYIHPPYVNKYWHIAHDFYINAYATLYHHRLLVDQRDPGEGLPQFVWVGSGLPLSNHLRQFLAALQLAVGDPDFHATATNDRVLPASYPKGTCFRRLIIGYTTELDANFPLTGEMSPQYRQIMQGATASAAKVFGAKPGPSSFAKPHVTILQRPDGFQRSISNLKELQSKMESWGLAVRVIRPHNEGMRDIIHATQNTTLFIAVHGSGLANAMFLPHGAVTIMLQPNNHFRYFPTFQRFMIERLCGANNFLFFDDNTSLSSDPVPMPMDIMRAFVARALELGVHKRMKVSWKVTSA